MSTRSLTHIQKDGKTFCTIYRHCDGYPEGMGADLKRLAGNIEVLNYSAGKIGTHANTMGCLAAQIIADLKEEVGNIYVYPPDSSDCWEEYIYTLTEKDGDVYLKCVCTYQEKPLYDGLLRDWDVDAIDYDEDEDEE